MNVAGRFHLTYCSNIHAGETWDQVRTALAGALPAIRQQLNVDGPFAIGLRLSAQAAEQLEQPRELAAFRNFLRDGNYYVPTINGFPYGAFHGRRVKERVYLPDWRSPDRLAYSNRLATLLASLLSEQPSIEGSVSTVPGAFKAHMTSDADVEAVARGVLQHAAHLVTLRRETGITVTLAIEPEPACFIETVAEAVDFFTRYLFDADAVRTIARDTGTDLSLADVYRHIGVCFDACHMAVEFEDPALAMQQLHAAGIRICKVQVSSALRIRRPLPGSDARVALQRFADDTYLHQVVQRDGDTWTRYSDLPDALASAGPGCRGECEWRVHFHVPVFLAAMCGFETTQLELASTLDALKRNGLCDCLEVETYTWDVLPPEFRTTDLPTAIARELAWVRDRLEA